MPSTEQQLIQSADRLISNENIAIGVLALVVVGLVCAVVAQWKRNREIENARVAQEKSCADRIEALTAQYQEQLNILLGNFRSDVKEAFAHAKENNESVRELTTQIKLLGQAAVAAAAGRNLSG